MFNTDMSSIQVWFKVSGFSSYASPVKTPKRTIHEDSDSDFEIVEVSGV